MKEAKTNTAEKSGWVESLKLEYGRESARIMDSHFNGAGGMAVVREVTKLTDRILRSVFERACREMGVDARNPGWVLTAVGGYGRGELNPYSDVDIMFLGRPGGPDKDNALPMRALHLLWDLGINIGYSVREVDDCLPLVRQDITIMTSLLEARYLAGEKEIFAGFEVKIKGCNSPKAVDAYIREKLIERTRRHKKHGDSVYLREPNIKEGAGGLRDIHAAIWISKMKYGVDTIGGLMEKGVIKGPDSRRLVGARDYLLRLRNELHYLSGHRQDVLTFDLQEKVAVDFGYTPRANRMAVENFMRAYYLRARGVREATQGIIEKALGRPGGWKWPFISASKRRIDDRFYTMGRTLCMSGDPKEIFYSAPDTILQAFSLSQSLRVPMSANLKDSISDNLMALNKKSRESKEAGRRFIEVMGRLEGSYETLDLMHKMKVLGRFLPEFGAVSALVQHDLYHMYTVDEHSLLAIKKLEDLLGGAGQAYPEFTGALRRVKDRQVLMLAALLHDAGKAAGPGHAEKGARIASRVALRLGMENERAEKVEFLVRNHLLMAHLSQRRELSDPKVIEKFCRIVDSQELLDMLYLLTYADVSAVGPELFNDWKMMLLKELHDRAAAFLKDEVSALAHEKERLARLRSKITAVAGRKGTGSADEIKRFLDNLPANYPLSVPAETAVHHFELMRGLKGGEIIIDHEHDRRGYTNLTIMLHEVLGVSYVSAGALSAKNMNILSAQIFTCKDGVIIDTLQVTDCNKKPALDEKLWAGVKASLRKLLTGQARVEDLMPHGPVYAKRTALKDVPVKVVVDNEASDRYTVVEVYAPDRIGLLYDITRALYRLGCYISTAKVDTDVDRVVDVFYVSDIFKQKIEDKERIKTISDTLAACLAGDNK